MSASRTSVLEFTLAPPVYRLYNPYAVGNSTHHYTVSWKELEQLREWGWQPEGICWYAQAAF